MKKVLKALAIAATVVVALVSCKKEAQEVALTGIELNAVTQALQVGQDFQLTVTYKPADATNKPAATWESDTPAVATVADGKVTAVAAGTAKITAKVASFSATCTVTVTEESSGEVDLSGADVWSLIGDFNSWGADVDLQKTASSPETWEVKGVALSGGVKFRGNHDWGNYDLGAKDAVESGKELALVHKGGNITVAEGTYDVVLYPTELKAVFTLAEGPEPQGIITLDGDFSDWADIEGVSDGTYGQLKVALDENYIYFLSHRTTAGRYSEIWNGGGYVYFGLNLDGDDSTGETLNGVGPYEFVFFISPYGGSADAPAIAEDFTVLGYGAGCLPSTCSIKNVFGKGAVTDEGAIIEFRVPLEDIPELPESFTVYSQGNKDLAKVVYPFPYVAPEPEPVEAPESDVITVDILPDAYPQEEVVVKNGDIEYNIYLVANYGNGIQMKKGGGYISNKTAFKSINTIKITTAESKTLYPENLKLYAGTTENPTTEIAMKSGDKEVAVWELDGEYTYFKMENVSTYAVYLSKIEINPAAEPAPAGITLDGNFDDWADVPGFESSGNTTKEWKFASDDENIYLYFKIERSDVIASKTDDPTGSGIFPYNWRRYCTFIIDTDNNPATGTDKTYKDLHLTGAEAWGLFYPFRGNANTASGTDGNPSVVNGVEEQGGVETPSTDKVKVYGVVEEDFAYLEVEISRASIGSPASGKMTIQVGLSYNNPDPQEVTLK